MLSTFRALLAAHGRDLAALLLRVTFGLFLVVNHGWGKLMKWDEKHATFSDPLHISPPLSMAGTIAGELFFPLLVIAGVYTRLATLPVIFTMVVAAVLVHSDSILDKGEHALLFAFGYAAIALLGPGNYSIDGARGRA
jgi:putative oxidoreductase